ncbi:Rab3 GTPase-activating protein catalytic subunit [Phlyctochytrium planicorne]|nr:Rab3 GTPase-activating protein catalytic subunit [Phlyctochytrium planicorne]
MAHDWSNVQYKDALALGNSSIHRWFGLTHFLCLRPQIVERLGKDEPESRYSAADLFGSGGKASNSIEAGLHKMLLSGIQIALQNTDCLVPAFVQYGPSWKNAFSGVGFSQGEKGYNIASPLLLRTLRERSLRIDRRLISRAVFLNSRAEHDFDIEGANTLYRLKTFLSNEGRPGIYQVKALHAFMWKRLARDLNIDPLQLDDFISEVKESLVSILTTYQFSAGAQTEWDFRSFTSPSVKDARIVPIGFMEDPLLSLQLRSFIQPTPVQTAILPFFVESSPSDWSLSIRLRHDVSKLPMLAELLNDVLCDWLPLLQDSDSPLAGLENEKEEDALKHDNEIPRADSSEATAIRALNFGKRAVLSALGTEAVDIDSGKGFGVVDMMEVQEAISQLFSVAEHFKVTENESDINLTHLDTAFGKLRDPVSVPLGSFFWILCHKILDILSPVTKTRLKTRSDGFVKQLWLEIVRELRRRWELAEPIPHVFLTEIDQASHVVDLRQSLLHQKLYMLNCCIYRKRLLAPVGLSKRRKEDPVELPNRGDKDSTVVSMLSNFASTALNDISSGGFLADVQHRSKSVLGMFGDRLGALEPPTELGITTYSKPVPFTKGDNHSVSRSLQGVGSWTSDRSWELYGDSGERRRISERPPFAGKNSDSASQKDQADVFYDPGESENDDYTSRKSIRDGNGVFEADESIMMESFIELESDTPTAVLSPAHAILDDKLLDEPNPHHPDGVANAASGLQLLRGGTLNIPLLQDPCLMTEDMLLEQEKIFENLGTSAEATKIRARMQCAQLKSDMEAFKAANPGCILADFVRWHSPRDWIEDSLGNGHLSSRMLEPGNLWDEIWQSSDPIPANKQKPLFNIEKEAERTMFYFETLPTADIFSLKFGAFERKLSIAISLSKKLPLQYDLISNLVCKGNCNVEKTSERDTVWELLSEDTHPDF